MGWYYICEEIILLYKNRIFKIVRIISGGVAASFAIASLVAFIAQWNSPIRWFLFFVTLITTVQGILPFLHVGNNIRHKIHLHLKKKMYAEIDSLKQQYLDILDGK